MRGIIGLDFGNYNTFMCCILGMDMETRTAGNTVGLMPDKWGEGIPSAYLPLDLEGIPSSLSKEKKRVGEQAVSPAVTFCQHYCLRSLKSHVNEIKRIQEKEISYNQAITEVVQHCIQTANGNLVRFWDNTALWLALLANKCDPDCLTDIYGNDTNLVSLAYPATYSSDQRRKLVELVEKATACYREKVKVYGTIAEPAAAALAFNAEHGLSPSQTTVLVYDLGMTFDLSLVSVYPRGRRSSAGHIYYYDIIATGENPGIGGHDFDWVVFNILRDKYKDITSSSVFDHDMFTVNQLWEFSRIAKERLSNSEIEYPCIYIDKKPVTVPITRQEFEEAAKEPLMNTIMATYNFLYTHQNQRPDYILLTGEASQMPMVRREMEKMIPEYGGRIFSYRPSSAIAYGAARYGTTEMNLESREIDRYV